MLRFRVVGVASIAVVIACADGPVAPPAMTPVSEPVTSDPPSNLREITLSLVGRGFTTEWHTSSPTGDRVIITTDIEAATRALITGLPVDTLLAISFSGVPALGRLDMTPPTTVRIQDVSPGIPLIFFEGSPSRVELMFFARHSAFPVQELIQAQPAALEVTNYVAPSRFASDGLVQGKISFLAAEYYREWAPDGAITIRERAEQVLINAGFEVQLTHRIREVGAPGS